MSKILGGKSGKLKCTQCDRPRYPQVDLCPTCYYGKMKWYAVKYHMDESETVYESYWYDRVIRATSIHHAMNITFRDSESEDGYHYIMFIPDEWGTFDTEEDACKYLAIKKLEEMKVKK